ncbi:MAG TPA: hypothetical protein VFK91_05945 [Methyloceanibacter sp.]|nr:hypothetical protein [Methyloceanibacter sp.]
MPPSTEQQPTMCDAAGARTGAINNVQMMRHQWPPAEIAIRDGLL